MPSIDMPALIVLFLGILFVWWYYRQPRDPFST